MSGITLKLPEGDCALHCFRNDVESRSIVAPTLVFQDGKVVRTEEYYMSKYQVGKLPYDVTRVIEMVLAEYYLALLSREIEINLASDKPDMEMAMDIQKRVGLHATFYYVRQQAQFVRKYLNGNHTDFESEVASE